MTAHGLPDQSRAARIILKDYVNGRLLYCHLPPEFTTTVPVSEPLVITSLTKNTDIKSKHQPTITQEDEFEYLNRQKDVVAVQSGRYGKRDFTRTKFAYKK